MERGHDIGGARIQMHLFKGLFLTIHVFEAFVRLNEGKKLVNDIRRDIGIGYP